MDKKDQFDRVLSPGEVRKARERRLDAQHLQEIEGNPFNAEDVAMFEMFERERWPFAKRREYIIQQALGSISPAAAAE